MGVPADVMLAHSVLSGEQGILMAVWPSWPPLEQAMNQNHISPVSEIRVYSYWHGYILIVKDPELPDPSGLIIDDKEEAADDLLTKLQGAVAVILDGITGLEGEPLEATAGALAKSLDIFAMHLNHGGFHEKTARNIREIASLMRQNSRK